MNTAYSTRLTTRLGAFALATVTTLSLLSGIDHLASTGSADSVTHASTVPVQQIVIVASRHQA